MLAEADCLVVCAPLTPETEDLLGAAEFAALKPGAVFVNIGRGAIVDEHALLRGLREGRIAFAAVEPVDAQSFRPRGIAVSPQGNDAHAECARNAGDLTADAAGTDDRHRLPGELDAGEAMPLARSLFVQEPADLLRVEEQRGKDELGQRLGVDTTGRGDDKVGILQAQPLHQGTDARRRRLHPTHLWGELKERASLVLWEIEQNLRLGQQPMPFPLLLGVASPGGITVIRDVARRGHQIGAKDDVDLIRERVRNALDILGFERRGQHH